MKRLRPLLSFCCGLVILSCATVPKRLEPLAVTKQELFRDLQQRQEAIRTLRGEARIRYGSQVRGQWRKAMIAVRRPLDFRFDFVSDLGWYQSQVVSRMGAVTIFWNQKNRFYSGVGIQEDLSRSLALPLSPEEVARVLLTTVLFEAESDYRLLATREGWVLKGERQEILCERIDGTFLPVRMRMKDLAGRVAYEVRYQSYRDWDPLLYPQKINGRFGRSRMQIEFTTLEINPRLKPDLFVIEIPDDAIRVYD